MKTFQENIELNEVLLELAARDNHDSSKVKLSDIHSFLKKTLEAIQVDTVLTPGKCDPEKGSALQVPETMRLESNEP